MRQRNKLVSSTQTPCFDWAVFDLPCLGASLLAPAFCYLTLCLMLASCVSTYKQPAPVLERTKETRTSRQEPQQSDPKNSPATTQSKKNLSSTQYEVMKGDTLYSIGKKLGIPHQKIAEANHIENNAIYVGQILNISNDIAQNNPNDQVAVVTQPLKTTEMPVASETKPVSTEDDVPKPSRNMASDTENNPTGNNPTSTIDIDAIPDQQIEWRWPAKGKLVAEYDPRSNKGIDIAGNSGQPILAAGAGKVIYSGADIRGYGKLVIIKHNRNYLSVYAHQGNILVKEGQLVSLQHKIAEMGRDNSATSKLHFEIRKNGKTVDPKEYLPTL